MILGLFWKNCKNNKNSSNLCRVMASRYFSNKNNKTLHFLFSKQSQVLQRTKEYTMETRNILIMVTGSVAAVKLPNLIRRLQSDERTKYNIKVTLTEHALHFISLHEIQSLLPEPQDNFVDKCSNEDESLSLTTTPTGSSGKSFCYKSPFDKNHCEAHPENRTKEILNKKTIFLDQDEWSNWNVMGDPVLHIVLRNWAHVGVIAPLDANTLGKMSSGI